MHHHQDIRYPLRIVRFPILINLLLKPVAARRDEIIPYVLRTSSQLMHQAKLILKSGYSGFFHLKLT